MSVLIGVHANNGHGSSDDAIVITNEWLQVNNAGIGDGGPVDWMSMDAYRKVMDVNFFGMVDCVKQALPMLKRSKGRVVNVSSLAGQIPGTPIMSGYCASKHAADAFTTSLRIELIPWGIKV